MESFLIYLLKSGGVLILFYGVYQLLLKKETFFFFNRIFLFTGIIISTILPLIHVTKTVILKLASQHSVTNIATTTVNQSWHLNYAYACITFIYTFGAMLFFYRLFKEIKHLRKLIISGTKNANKNNLYITTDKNISPFSFFRWIVYNPNLHSKKELDIILDHEKVHATQYHSIDIIVMELFLALQWFNPIAWLYRKSIKENLEFLADANTCKSHINKKEYQYILLKQVIGQGNISIVNPFFNSLIKKRIVMINQHPSKKSRALKSLIILPFLALFLLSFNIKNDYKFENLTTNNSTEKSIEIVITKTTTDQELIKIKNDLAKEKIDVSYTTVRNKNGEISALSLDISGGKNSANEFSNSFSSNLDTDTISPTYVVINPENHTVFIGNKEYEVEEMTETEEHSSITYKSPDNKEPLFFIDGKESNTKDVNDLDPNKIASMNVLKGNNATKKYGEKAKNGVMEITTKKDIDSNKEEHDIEIIEIRENDSAFVNSISINGQEPLYFIDGKKSSSKKANQLNPNNIASMNVLKGDYAIKIYGKKAKNGVVEITTKK